MSLIPDSFGWIKTVASHWNWVGSGGIIGWALTKFRDWYAIRAIPRSIRVEGSLEVAFIDVEYSQEFRCEVEAVNASSRPIKVANVYLECDSDKDSWPQRISLMSSGGSEMKIEPHHPKKYVWIFRRLGSDPIPIEVLVTPVIEIYLPPPFYRRMKIGDWRRTVKGRQTTSRII